MIREEGGGRGAAREVARVLSAFARTARARRLYRPNNAVLVRLSAELASGMQALLRDRGEISLRVRPDSLVYEDEIVLEEPNPDDSIPYTFYRDGIRRVDLVEGLEQAELEVLVAATAEGFSQSGLGDDVVSFLWRNELSHVRTVVVDTTIVEAAGKPEKRQKDAPLDLDEQIDALIHEIYGQGRGDDVGPRTVRVDASDLSARDIARTLGEVDDMAPGFHPARALVEPLYAILLRSEVEDEGDDLLLLRVIDHAVRALSGEVELDEADRRAASDALLAIFDASIVAGGYTVAARAMAAVRARQDAQAVDDAPTAWVTEAVSEARLRQLAQVLQAADPAPDVVDGVFLLLEASGPRAVPAILGMIPDVPDAARRRALGEVALRAGIERLEPVRALLVSEQSFVALEALHLLSLLVERDPRATELLLMGANHPQPVVRKALLERLGALPRAAQLTTVVQLMEDVEPDVRRAAIELLGGIREVQALRTIEAKVKSPSLGAEPLPIKRALLLSYARLAGAKTVPNLARWFTEGSGVFAKKEAEELSIAAAAALGVLATPAAVAALKKAGGSLNMRVRDAAQAALRHAAERVRARGGEG